MCLRKMPFLLCIRDVDGKLKAALKRCSALQDATVSICTASGGLLTAPHRLAPAFCCYNMIRNVGVAIMFVEAPKAVRNGRYIYEYYIV
jgi:hypothetical protein